MQNFLIKIQFRILNYREILIEVFDYTKLNNIN